MEICACAVLLGAMSLVVGWRRPTAADVRPGSELYEKIIRALRGELTNASDLNRAERHCAVVKESAHRVASVAEVPFPAPFSTEDLPSIETPPSTPPLKRSCRLQDTVETAAVGSYEEFEVAKERANEPPAVSNATEVVSTNSTIMELSSASKTVATGALVRPTPVPLETQSVQCAVAEKLQKISQVDKTCSTRIKPQSKYKPPYKIEKSRKSSMVLHQESVISQLLAFSLL